MKSFNTSALYSLLLLICLSGCTTTQPSEGFEKPGWMDLEEAEKPEDGTDEGNQKLSKKDFEEPVAGGKEGADSLVEALFSIDFFDEKIEQKQEREAAEKAAAKKAAEEKARRQAAAQKEKQEAQTRKQPISAAPSSDLESDSVIPSLELEEEKGGESRQIAQTAPEEPAADVSASAQAAPTAPTPEADKTETAFGATVSSLFGWAGKIFDSKPPEPEAGDEEQIAVEDRSSTKDTVPGDTVALANMAGEKSDADAGPAEPPAPVIPKVKSLTAINREHRGQAEAAKQYYDLALSQLDKGETDAALRLFKDISSQYPLLSGPKVNQAIILRRQGQLEAAKNILQEALYQKTGSYYVLNELGVVYRQMGQFRQARQAYETAIRKEPAYDKPYYNLGILADLYLHEPELALESFRKYQALQVKPDKRVAGWIVEIERRMNR